MNALLPYVWIGALLFARIGSVLMLAPGWGEAAVSARFRLTAALLATFAVSPTVASLIPPLPTSFSDMIFLLISEIMIGLMFGAAARIFMSAASIAGQVVSLHTGLGFAMQMDPMSQQQGVVLGTFFSLIATLLVLGAGIHRWMLEGAVDSYALFPPGQMPSVGDAAEYGLTAFTEAFRLGLQIAAPAIAFGLIFNLALGLAARLIPQIQIYFIAMPSSIMLGLIIVSIGMGAGLLAWMDAFDRFLNGGAF